MRGIQGRIGAWHRQRFPRAQAHHVALKLCEEVGEVASGVLATMGPEYATGRGDVLGEAADVCICLFVLVERWTGGNLLAEVERKLAILNDLTSGHRSSLISG